MGTQPVDAVRTGDVEALRAHLAADPELANARVAGQRTLLHVATDWPGHFPNAVETVAVLLEAGADVDARFNAGGETPLMWAASSDDVAVLDALLDAGAEIDAEGAIIGGGTALDDAWAFGQWNAARRLVERGATPSLLAAAALGLELDAEGDITEAFWAACHGGQRRSAELLLARGADPRWVGWDALTPEQAARRSGATELADWIAGLPR